MNELKVKKDVSLNCFYLGSRSDLRKSHVPSLFPYGDIPVIKCLEYVFLKPMATKIDAFISRIILSIHELQKRRCIFQLDHNCHPTQNI